MSVDGAAAGYSHGKLCSDLRRDWLFLALFLPWQAIVSYMD
jgi:hypothetical protein